MRVTLSLITLLVCTTGFYSAFASDMGYFTWGKDDPLLSAAMQEDSFSGLTRPGVQAKDLDAKKAYELYEQYLKERELTPQHQAEILAHLGMLDMYATEGPDTAKAKAHFEEAFKLVGAEYLTEDLIAARTNYASLLADPQQQFDAYVENIKMLISCNAESLEKAFAENHPDLVQMYHGKNPETGEEIHVPLADIYPDMLQEPKSKQNARNMAAFIKNALDVQYPDVCVQAAMLTSDPQASLQRLMIAAPASAIADKAKASYGLAKTIKEVNADLQAEQEQK